MRSTKRIGAQAALCMTGLLLAAAPGIAAAAAAGASVPAQTDTASSGGVVPIKVSCPAGGAACTGTLSLKTGRKVAGKFQSLGSAPFSVATGKTSKIKLKLNAEGRKLLKQGRFSPRATATTKTSSGQTVSQSRKITIKKHHSSGGFY